MIVTNKDKCNKLLQSNNFHDFLDKLLQNFKVDFTDYKLKNGFISFLEETKVNERFSIISAFGRFKTEDGMFNIGGSEIDTLSIVYLKKDGIFINKKYIDIMTKHNQDVFLYIEFEEELSCSEQEKFKRLIEHIKNIIMDKNWNVEMENIIHKVNSLEPLSKTVLDILTFSTKEEKTSKELIELIEQDIGLVATLLKVSNSALFGFKNKVESLENLVSLLGINFTISMVLSNNIENSLKMDYSVYGHTPDSFSDIIYSKINLLKIWVCKVDIDLANSLMIPIILSDIGKYIISHEIMSMNLKENFIRDCKDLEISIDEIENKHCAISSLEVTSLLLNNWGISKEIISNIKNNKKIEIINIVCNTREQFTQESILKAITKAQQYGFDISILEDSIKKFQKNLEF